MISKQQNAAYIDGANLYKGIEKLGWRLDYARFRVWLREKYSVERAYIFIGLVPKYSYLYTYLQESGFTLVFKETISDGDGKIKGNCDADLVLYAVRDYYEKRFNGFVLVSSDGDYAGLVQFMMEKRHLQIVLSPGNKCSVLLRRTNAPIVYLDSQRAKFEAEKKKPPQRTEP